MEEENNRNVVLVDGKQWKCGAGGSSGVKIKKKARSEYLKRRKVGKGTGVSKQW